MPTWQVGNEHTDDVLVVLVEEVLLELGGGVVVLGDEEVEEMGGPGVIIVVVHGWVQSDAGGIVVATHCSVPVQMLVTVMTVSGGGVDELGSGTYVMTVPVQG